MSNSKFSTPSKIYIARLLGLDVFDPFGDRLGRLRDVVVLKRGLGASIAGARPAKGSEPIVVGIIVEVLGKKRVFMPMTRVRSIDASQIISTGLVNLRRFEQRNSETLIVGELFDRRVRLLDGSGDAVIEDVAIEQRDRTVRFPRQLLLQHVAPPLQGDPHRRLGRGSALHRRGTAGSNRVRGEP